MKKIIFILITLFVFSFSQRIYASNSGVFSDGKTIKNLKKDLYKPLAIYEKILKI